MTNPPYKRAEQFLEKALADARYVALLLRSKLLARRRGPHRAARPPASADASVDRRSPFADDASSGMDRKAGLEQYGLFLGHLGQAGQRARIPAPVQLAGDLRAAGMGGLALKSLDQADVGLIVRAV